MKVSRSEIWFKRNIKGDPVIWTIAFLLAVFGVLAVYSASSAFSDMESNKILFKQLFFFGFSMFFIWLFHNVDYKYYIKLSRPILLFSVVLLMFTYLLGVEQNGAVRRLTVPLTGFTFQTSDLVKVALIADLARMLAMRQDQIADFKKSLVPILVWTGLPCAMIAYADLSSALQLFVTCVVVMFIGRVSMKHLIALFGIGLAGVLIVLLLGQRSTTSAHRMEDWKPFGKVDPSSMPKQVYQAHIAIAEGGILGNGLGQGQNDVTIFLAFSDYIYAKIINDMGSFSGVLLIFLYLALLYRGMKVAARSNRAFGGLLSAGLAFALVIQAMMHMAVNVGITPATGIPLPFVSLGGTSMLFTGITLGIILSVSRGDAKNENENGNVQTETIQDNN